MTTPYIQQLHCAALHPSKAKVEAGTGRSGRDWRLTVQHKSCRCSRWLLESDDGLVAVEHLNIVNGATEGLHHAGNKGVVISNLTRRRRRYEIETHHELIQRVLSRGRTQV